MVCRRLTNGLTVHGAGVSQLPTKALGILDDLTRIKAKACEILMHT